MLDSTVTAQPRSNPAADDKSVSRDGMVWLPGGTFRMGSDRHYSEEAPVHRVTVDGFWMDRTPVTNLQFQKFVSATGYITVAEIAPDPKDYPGALPQMLYTGVARVLPAAPAGRPARLGAMVALHLGRQLAPPLRPGQQHRRLDDHPVVACRLSRCRTPMRTGPARTCPTRSRMGICRAGRARRMREFAWGDELTPGGRTWPTPGRASFLHQNCDDGRL